MPRLAGANVPTAASVSASGAPVARICSPRDPSSSLPSHSRPTCLTPKSSRDWSVKRTVSESRSTPLPPRPSTVIVGGSSSRATRLTVSGLLPERPSRSFQTRDRSTGSSTSTSGATIADDCGATSWPSIAALANSRLAVAVTATRLPLTTDKPPPRSPFAMGASMPRYSGRLTSAESAVISGRNVGWSVTSWRASPTASRKLPGLT